jgi:hypothetical protein
MIWTLPGDWPAKWSAGAPLGYSELHMATRALHKRARRLAERHIDSRKRPGQQRIRVQPRRRFKRYIAEAIGIVESRSLRRRKRRNDAI